MSAQETAPTRQEEILDRTIELVREAGLAGLTMKKVAERVGFTEPAIYRHFPNKQALVLGMAGRLGGMFLARIREVAAREDLPPLERLEAIVAHHIGLILETDGLPVLLLAEATASGDEALIGRMAEIPETYLALVGKIASEIPLPPGSPPPGRLGLPLLGLGAAVAVQRRLFPGGRQISEEDALALARFVVRRLFQPEVEP